MPDLINFITQGVNEFTPATVCGLMVFSMIFEGLFMTIGNIVSIGRGRR